MMTFHREDDICHIQFDEVQLFAGDALQISHLDKSTYPKLLELTGSKQKAQALFQSALAKLDQIPYDTTVFSALD